MLTFWQAVAIIPLMTGFAAFCIWSGYRVGRADERKAAGARIDAAFQARADDYNSGPPRAVPPEQP